MKKGRKPTDNPKDFMLRVRMDAETLRQLDACCEAGRTNRSEVVREGIRLQYQKNKK